MRDNRANHRSRFEAAIKGYRATCIKALDRRIAMIRDQKMFDMRFTLPVPEDHTDDYDRAITMLSFSLDEKITLSEHEFECYMRDSWSWSHAFSETSTKYGA
jgi:hypothetical protein